jgi:hypothetical protein
MGPKTTTRLLTTPHHQQLTLPKPHPINTAPPTRWRLLSAVIDQCCRHIFVITYVTAVLATALTLVTTHVPLVVWSSES